MKQCVILGAGTAGTMMANKLQPLIGERGWQITVVDMNEEHIYQPGLLFIPFGVYKRSDVIKPRRHFLPRGVDVIMSPIEVVIPDENKVKLENGKILPYDMLIIATGCDVFPEEIEGMKEAAWEKNIFHFYGVENAERLHEYLKNFNGGKLVLNIAEMPIKCPVAPLEFLFLADWYFTEVRGIRDKVEIEFVTPLDGAFTKPLAAKVFGSFLGKKNIHLKPGFNLARVDYNNNKIVAHNGDTVDYDCLVSIPLTQGAPYVGNSGMDDASNYVPTNKNTLQSRDHKNIFVIGDASDLPTSKAGSVAHFEADVLTPNIMKWIEGKEPTPDFDGHANCFIETGFKKAILIDFNYTQEPLPGKFPLPGVGPFSLLMESEMNHWGKMMFRWVYWNILVRGKEMPIESQLELAGKYLDAAKHI